MSTWTVERTEYGRQRYQIVVEADSKEEALDRATSDELWDQWKFVSEKIEDTDYYAWENK